MSMRKAINEKCKDCIYDPLACGTWLKQVELCTCIDCPLYRYRPITRETKQARKLATENGKGVIYAAAHQVKSKPH